LDQDGNAHPVASVAHVPVWKDHRLLALLALLLMSAIIWLLR